MDWLDEIKLMHRKAKSSSKMQVITAVAKQESPGGDYHIVQDCLPDPLPWVGRVVVLPLDGFSHLDRANWHLRGSGYQIVSDEAQNYRLVNEEGGDLPGKHADIAKNIQAAHMKAYAKAVPESLGRPAHELELVEERRDQGTTSWFFRPKAQTAEVGPSDNVEIHRDLLRQVTELFNTLLDDRALVKSIGAPVLREIARVRNELPDYDKPQVESKDPRINQILDRFRTGRNALGRDAGTDDEAHISISFKDFKYMMLKLGLRA